MYVNKQKVCLFELTDAFQYIIKTNKIRICFKINRLTLLKTRNGNKEEKQILLCRSLKNIAFKLWIVRKRMRKINEWNPFYGSHIGSHINLLKYIAESTKVGFQTLFMFPTLRNLFNSSNYSTALPTKYSLYSICATILA